MPDCSIKRALISVYDKTGVVDFARTLVGEFGVEILSTGGTATLLTDSGIPVTLVEDITGWGEMLDGRVKTLHPKIHAGILADRDNPDHMRQLEEAGIKPIDMVVVNLYPFEKTVANPECTFDEAIEMIDIGGPCMLRAAAKNHKHVLIASDPALYTSVLDDLRSGNVDRAAGAKTVFSTTTHYDAQIAKWLQKQAGAGVAAAVQPPRLDCSSMPGLSYGENPHQEAFPCQTVGGQASPDLVAAWMRSGQQFSFNNLVDADAALALCTEFPKGNVCVFVKHTNACGVGVADDAVEAYRRAYLGDPNAAMGGILACNFRIGTDFADAVMHSLARWGKEAGAGAFFAEVWLAPQFDDDAVATIRGAKEWGKRVRLLKVAAMGDGSRSNAHGIRSIAGGALMQTPDTLGLNEDQWKVVTDRQPTSAEMDDLRLAWLVCKHTKSNAITVCKDGMLIGNGAGQMSRVMSCRIATWLAKENGHADKLAGAVAASDAFFPFRDGPDILMDAGVTAIIQPGGSKRDDDTIAACNERGVAMIVTGTRHFRH